MHRNSDGQKNEITEELLRNNNALFRASFEFATCSKGVTTLDGGFIKVNPAFCHMLGYSEEELLSFTCHDITHPEDVAQDIECYRQLIDGEIENYKREKRLVHKQGIDIWVVTAVVVVRNEAGEPLFMIGELHDITERKRISEAQKKLVDQLQMATVTAKLGIWNLDLKTHHLDWNDVMFDIHGITRDKFKGTIENWRASIHPYDLPYAESRLNRAASGEQLFDIHYRIIRPDYDLRHIEASITPQYDENGQVVSLLGVDVDDTVRYRSEQALRQAQEELEARVERRTSALAAATAEAERANLAKSEFLSRTSHELRTPLNAILGFAQILEMDGTLREKQRQSVNYILQGGRHLLGLINDLLDLTTIGEDPEELTLEPVSLSEAMDEVLSLMRPFAQQNGIELRPDSNSWCDVNVLVDSQRLRQVLLNLVSNAIKYNRMDGIVTLACDVEVLNPSLEEVSPLIARIKVTDTGNGIPPDKLQGLYAPFNRLGAERTTIEGTGLGLTISKVLVEAMNGALLVDSTVGVGTTFTLELPLSPQIHYTITSPQAKAGLNSNVPTTKTILYIEDNASNYDLIAMILRDHQHIKLMPAIQGSIGLELARLHKPDLILLDLHLPDMKGEAVLRQLRDTPETVGIPVVILTADAMPAQMKRLLAEGAKAYLTKPIDMRKFEEILDELLV